jgi:prepilin-type N-terminal cleavage/methylation domain-containing protein
MTISANLKIRKMSSGFSLIELILVVALIAIMAMVTYAALNRYVPGYRVRAEAKAFDGLLQKARLLAATSQKPVRVVLNCSKAVDDTCAVITQVASFTGATVTDWTSVQNGRRVFHRSVMAVKLPKPTTSDGSVTYPGIYWAIFMPDSRVFSDPRPFDLFFLNDTADLSKSPLGWQISLSNDAGRISSEQTTLPIS